MTLFSVLLRIPSGPLPQPSMRFIVQHMRISLFYGIMVLLLASCGFRPVYQSVPQGEQGESTLSASALHYIAVDPIPHRNGQILRVALEDRLHPQGNVAPNHYKLAVWLDERRQPIIIERTGRITRYNIIFEAKYRVYHPETKAELVKGKTRRISSYNAADSDFATFIGERDAKERGLKELAHDITLRLASAFEEAPLAPLP